MNELTIRPLTEADAPRLFELIDDNRPQLAKFWWERNTQSVEDSRNFITHVLDDEATNGAPTRAICVDGQMEGVASLHTIDWENRRSLMGYWIDHRQAGKGHTTEAVRMLLDEAFNDLELDEVRISARATNRASLKIAEKLGFSLLEMTNQPTWKSDEPVETAIYSLHRQSQPAMAVL